MRNLQDALNANTQAIAVLNDSIQALHQERQESLEMMAQVEAMMAQVEADDLFLETNEITE
jgi:hypothetical protein